MKKFTLKAVVGRDDPGTAIEFLADRTDLSKTRIKDVMNKGAVWLTKRKRRRRRARRAKTAIGVGDRLELFFDERILAEEAPQAEIESDQERYSVWRKPPGLMSQGTMFGDHCSLERRAALFFGLKRKIFVVHRLDREASGLMLLAHDKKAAARLSELFRENRIVKRYRIEALGRPTTVTEEGGIEIPLDGKRAVTRFRVIRHDAVKNTSVVDVFIDTGRRHQIRRHFDRIGHPVMGDPRYGRGNKNSEGLQLTAISLAFRCPFRREEMRFELEPSGAFSLQP